MPDFQELLSTSVDSVEKPKPLPTGHYASAIKSFKFDKANNEKQTPFCRFMIQPMEPQEDVDKDALGEVNKWRERPMRLDFYITEDAMWRFRKFLEKDAGINTTGRSFDECIPETVNQGVMIEVVHEINRQSGDTYAVINATSPVT